MSSNSTKYGAVSILVHWLIALATTVLLGLGLYLHASPTTTDERGVPFRPSYIPGPHDGGSGSFRDHAEAGDQGAALSRKRAGWRHWLRLATCADLPGSYRHWQ